MFSGRCSDWSHVQQRAVSCLRAGKKLRKQNYSKIFLMFTAAKCTSVVFSAEIWLQPVWLECIIIEAAASQTHISPANSILPHAASSPLSGHHSEAAAGTSPGLSSHQETVLQQQQREDRCVCSGVSLCSRPRMKFPLEPLDSCEGTAARAEPDPVP